VPPTDTPVPPTDTAVPPTATSSPTASHEPKPTATPTKKDDKPTATPTKDKEPTATPAEEPTLDDLFKAVESAVEDAEIRRNFERQLDNLLENAQRHAEHERYCPAASQILALIRIITLLDWLGWISDEDAASVIEPAASLYEELQDLCRESRPGRR
jgi:hypothetical protein